MKVIIIGGVAGGATAAARIRRLNEDAEIIVFERGSYISYANCGLPYYIGGEITEKESLTLQTPQSFHSRFRVDVRINSEVVKIDKAQKIVTVNCSEDGKVYSESYDKLLLSPGAKPFKPDLLGINDQRIFTLRNVEDTLAISEFIKKNKPKTATIVGGGFIGLEMAENLVFAGISPTIVQRSGQVMPSLDYDMACKVHSYLKSKGIILKLNQSLIGFESNEKSIDGLLKSGEKVSSEIVILAIGIIPDTKLAKEAGLDLGIKDSIKVNDMMETSEKDIYAVGDAVEITHYVSGKPALIALAGPANKQGRIVADNICGFSSHFHGTQGSSVMKLFDMTIANTGINEKTAKSYDFDYDKVVTQSASHATYYPGATSMTIKTLFEPQSGKILGAQIVGFDGVDKRCDIISTAIRGNMTALDLTELELGYAPPYSSAKDPVNVAGFVIENIMTDKIKQFHWHDIESLQKDGDVIFLDTRTTKEYLQGHIDSAINIPLDTLRENLSKLDKGKTIYVNCHSGFRSYVACRILMQSSFNCYNLSGGYSFYESVMSDKCWQISTLLPCREKNE